MKSPSTSRKWRQLRIAGILGLFALGALIVFAVQRKRPAAKMAVVESQGGPSPKLTFGVNAIGAASFDLPLELPPGTHDMAPDLKLSYNSSGGNGLMGLGWQLNGLSVITRSPATIAVDGFSGTIAYNADDRFAMDGQRLIAIDGPYGADGTVYHTQMESWTRLVSNGQSGNGPQSFTATTREGFTATYGAAPDARIPAVDRDGVSTWALDRLTDLNGNRLRFTYQHNALTGQYFPDSILYTEHDGQTGLRAVVFDYEDRGDSLLTYASGSYGKQTRRLKSVRTLVQGELVRSYTMTYAESAVTGRSRLTTIRTCNGAGQCARDLVLGWQLGGTGFNAASGYQSTTPITTGIPNYPEGFLDVNGDGKADFARFLREDGRYYLSVVLARTDRFVDGEFKSEVEPGNTTYPFSFSDVNGDGRADYARFIRNSELSVALATKDGFVDGQYTGTVEPGDMSKPFTYADVNGDGRTDYLRFIREDGKDLLAAALAGPSGFETGKFQSEVDPGDTSLPYGFVDVNGDNHADYVRFIEEKGTYYLSAALADEGGFRDGEYMIEADTGLYDLPRSFADINGDGRVDYISYRSDRGTKTLTAILSTGTGFSNTPFTQSTPVTPPVASDYPVSFVDVNGDGFQDFVRMVNSSSKPTLSAALVKPNGFGDQDFNSTSWVDPGIPTMPSRYADVNGDGRADFVRFLKISGGYYLTAVLADGQYPGLMTDFDNQKGLEYHVNYLPITNDTVYTRMDTLTYPNKEFQVPYYVVQSYDTEEYAYADQHVEFRYASAALDVTGRGFLGFGQRTQTDTRNDVSSEMYIQQIFPYSGMIDSVISRRVSDQMRQSKIAYAYTATEPVSQCWMVTRDTATTDMYTEGQSDYRLQTWSRYDAFGNILVEAKLGNLDQSGDEQFSNYAYLNDTTNAWRIGYKTDMKQGPVEDLDFTTYHPEKDLIWEKTEYDPNTFNITRLQKWDDQHDAWLGNTFAYDVYGNMTAVTDPLATTRLSYDPTFHTFVSSSAVPVRPGDSLITLTEYDPRFGVLTEQTDPNGKVMAFCLDGWGRLAATYGPAPSNVSSNSNNCSDRNLLLLTQQTYTETDSGMVTELRTRPTWESNEVSDWYWKKTYTNSSAQDFRKTSRGADGKEKIEEERYNGLGKTVYASLPHFAGETPITTKIEYEASGLIRSMTAANTRSTFRYTGGGHTVYRTVAAGTEMEATTMYEVNPTGQTLVMVSPDGGRTTFHYDALERLDTVIDPTGFTNVTVYTSLGSKSLVKNPDIGQRTFSYAPNGLLATETDALGQTTSYSYDLMARTTRKVVQGSSETVIDSFVYDAFDIPTAMAQGHLYQVLQSSNGEDGPTFTYSYDAFGQATSTRLQLDSNSPVYTMGASYSPLSQLQHAVYPDNSRLTLSRDVGGNLIDLSLENAVQGQRGNAVSFASFGDYNARSQPGFTSFGNGIRSTFTYDPLNGNLAEKLTRSPSGDTLQHNSLTWNSRQFVQQITDLRQNTAIDNTTQQFWYSATGRLDSASAPGTYGTQSYTYDLGGNFLEKGGIVYSDFSGHRALQGTKNGDQVFAATYDANGNLTEKVMDGTTWSYSYDPANRLKQVYRAGELVTSYTYDYTGRRLSKTEAGSSTTWYLFPGFEKVDLPEDGPRFTKYLDSEAGHLAAVTQPDSLTSLLAMANAEPGTNSWEALLTGPEAAQKNFGFAWAMDYFQVHRGFLLGLTLLVLLLCFWLLTRQWPVRGRRYTSLRFKARLAIPLMVFTQALVPLYATAGPTALNEAAHAAATEIPPGIPELGEQFFHLDHLGSTSLVTDHEGQVQSTAVYKPFGEFDQDHSSGANDYRAKFTGKELDEGTGLYYFSARFYDPVLGTFITADTELGGDANQADALNRYAYALNNPVIYTDPSGHSVTAVVLFVVFSAVISGLVAGAAVLIPQLIENGFAGVDWGQVLLAGAIGLVAGGVGAITAFGTESLLIVLAAKISASAAKSTLVSVGIGIASSMASGLATTLTTNTLNTIFGKEVNWLSSLGTSVLSGLVFGALGGFKGRVVTGQRIGTTHEAMDFAESLMGLLGASSKGVTVGKGIAAAANVFATKNYTAGSYAVKGLSKIGPKLIDPALMAADALANMALDYVNAYSTEPETDYATSMYNGAQFMNETAGRGVNFSYILAAEMEMGGNVGPQCKEDSN